MSTIDEKACCVVIDMMLSETAMLADYVLPGTVSPLEIATAAAF